MELDLLHMYICTQLCS